MARVALLASGAGSLAAAVVAAAGAETPGLEPVGVVSDRPDAGVLDRAAGWSLTRAVVSPRAHATRAAWDRALTETLLALRPDWVACLGFMRILGPATLEAFPDRIVNSHPALLPAFPGAHAVRDALAARAGVTGCTVHLVDAGVDTGPVLAQREVAVRAGDDEATLHDRIRAVERPLVVDALRALATDVAEYGDLDPARVRAALAPASVGSRR